jgi:hypothetical protein
MKIKRIIKDFNTMVEQCVGWDGEEEKREEAARQLVQNGGGDREKGKTNKNLEIKSKRFSYFLALQIFVCFSSELNFTHDTTNFIFVVYNYVVLES